MIDILCPILGRSPEAMLETLERNTHSSHEVFFVCSPDDPMIEVCRATGKPTWVMEWEPGKGDYARKINWAFAHTAGEWCLTAADDIRFHPKWDTQALRVAHRLGAQVIGTNDLHNPTVRAKQHATHILFERAYITAYGSGTVDGTGAVFCELYDHQYVDNEFVATAKQRGKWAFAAQSKVEHLHPVWKLAEWDATYEKSFREANRDHRLFTRRLRKIRPPR